LGPASVGRVRSEEFQNLPRTPEAHRRIAAQRSEGAAQQGDRRILRRRFVHHGQVSEIAGRRLQTGTECVRLGCHTGLYCLMFTPTPFPTGRVKYGTDGYLRRRGELHLLLQLRRAVVPPEALHKGVGCYKQSIFVHRVSGLVDPQVFTVAYVLY